MIRKINVVYNISSYPSKFLGYQSKRGIRGNRDIEGKITLYVESIWKYTKCDFDKFVNELIFIELTERICLERSFHQMKLHDRCKICSPNLLALFMQEILWKDEVKSLYEKRKRDNF